MNPSIEPRPMKCSARRSNGQPCNNPPIKGATVCRVHGGSAPQVKRKAEKRVALADWERTFGGPADDADPTTTVLTEIAWAKGHVEWMRDRIGSGETDWLKPYGEWSDRLARMCYLAHRMGIEAQQLRMAEQMGTAMTQLLQAVLLDLDPETRPRVRESFTRHLSALAGASAA